MIVAGAREAKALADAEGIRLEDAAPLRGAALGVPVPTLGTLYLTVRAAHPTL